MHDTAHFYVSRNTIEFFEPIDLPERRYWNELHRPNWNLIENLWSIVKIKLYEGGKQYKSKADQKESIKASKLETESSEPKNLQNQWIVDSWLLLKRMITI